MTTNRYAFKDPGTLIDGELTLVLQSQEPGDPDRGRVPAYVFTMVHTERRAGMGRFSLRIGHCRHITHYAGQIGYRVKELYQGHHFAARSVKLILPFAKECGLDPVWITCNPDNLASRRTCELAGGVLVETVDLPTDNEMYERGERRKCRYRFAIWTS